MAVNRSSTGNSYLILRRFHFWIGAVSALVIVLLAITGILLNHTQALKLDKRFLRSTVLLNWYGVQPPGSFNRFTLNPDKIVDTGDLVFLNDRPLGWVPARVTGAVSVEELLVISGEQELALFASSGELLEKVQIQGRGNIRRIGLSASGLLLIELGAQTGVYDLHAMAWVKEDAGREPELYSWSEVESIAPELEPEVLKLSMHNRVSFERFLQELHSGRIFGSLGVWIVDLVAIILLIQVLSGFILWRKLGNT